MTVPSGWADKLYWRQYARGALWHCFKRCEGGPPTWAPLCEADVVLTRSGGQASCRPPAWLRCPICDGAEMKRRGWDEGADESPDWRSGRCA